MTSASADKHQAAGSGSGSPLPGMTPGEFAAAAVMAGAAAASADLNPLAPYALVTGTLPDGRPFAVSPLPVSEHPEPGDPMPAAVEFLIFSASAGDPGRAFGDADVVDLDCSPPRALRLIAERTDGGRALPESARSLAGAGTPAPGSQGLDLALERRSPEPPPLAGGHPWAPGTPWYYRVALGCGQAVIGFPKFTTIAIGFQAEPVHLDLNYSYDRGTETIFRHIYPNKGSSEIGDARCREAILMVQEAAARDLAGPGAATARR